MSAILDDLKAGDFITVLEWRPRDMPVFAAKSWEPAGTTTIQDRSYCGHVLKVRAVDLPYVAVEHCKSPYLGVTKLDTRVATLKKLSADYVEAMLDTQREGAQ